MDTVKENCVVGVAMTSFTTSYEAFDLPRKKEDTEARKVIKDDAQELIESLKQILGRGRKLQVYFDDPSVIYIGQHQPSDEESWSLNGVSSVGVVIVYEETLFGESVDTEGLVQRSIEQLVEQLGSILGATDRMVEFVKPTIIRTWAWEIHEDEEE